MRLIPHRSELCMAVESMFSHGWLYRFHGTNYFADSAELTAFNALPSGMTADCKTSNHALFPILTCSNLSQGGHTTMSTRQTSPGPMSLTRKTIRGLMSATMVLSMDLSPTTCVSFPTYCTSLWLTCSQPCCTVNHPQGLPKFIAQAYARNGKDGIVHALLSPVKVKTMIEGGIINGKYYLL